MPPVLKRLFVLWLAVALFVLAYEVGAAWLMAVAALGFFLMLMRPMLYLVAALLGLAILASTIVSNSSPGKASSIRKLALTEALLRSSSEAYCRSERFVGGGR